VIEKDIGFFRLVVLPAAALLAAFGIPIWILGWFLLGVNETLENG
jgi:hypothetical protein